MRDISLTGQYKKDWKRCRKQPQFSQEILDEVVLALQSGTTLSGKYKDHKLHNSRDYKDCRELHLAPNLLLIYTITPTKITLVRMGSHQDTGITEMLEV